MVVCICLLVCLVVGLLRNGDRDKLVVGELAFGVDIDEGDIREAEGVDGLKGRDEEEAAWGDVGETVLGEGEGMTTRIWIFF